MTIPAERLDQIAHRFAELEARLASGTLVGDEFVAASRDYAELEPVAKAAQEVRAMRAEIAELAALTADPEMRALADEELAELRGKLPEAERRLAIAMLPRDSADARPAMLEIRAGTGGDEAALFAADLFRMYERFAAEQGWKVETISMNASDIGGFKEIVANVSGTGVFAKLKFESGVHRVQRVPVTESGGRIHTSAATVAVLPEPDEVDVQIDPGDIKIDIYRASGAGGQHVNTTDSAVRITHLPTGLVVIQQDERSQHKNRAKAMQVLRTRIYDLKRAEAHGAEAEARKAMVGSGDRSERLRHQQLGIEPAGVGHRLQTPGRIAERLGDSGHSPIAARRLASSSAVSASISSPRPWPSSTSGSLCSVRPMRWSVTRPCGKL